MFVQNLKSLPNLRKLGSLVAVVAVAWSLAIVVQAYYPYPVATVKVASAPTVQVNPASVADTGTDPNGVLGATTSAPASTAGQPATTAPVQAPIPSATSRTVHATSQITSSGPVPTATPDSAVEISPAPPVITNPVPPDPTICSAKVTDCVDESNSGNHEPAIRTYKPLDKL